jgi:hypothetical protein
MIQDSCLKAPFFQKRRQIIRSRVGAVKLNHGRLNQDYLRGNTAHFNPSFMIKEKQCFPVERKTSWEGRLRHFIPNKRQALGKEASQLTLKYTHCRQFGALSGGAGGPELVLKG